MIYPQDSRGHLQKHTDIDTALAGALSLTTLATTDADPTSAFRVQQDARQSATFVAKHANSIAFVGDSITENGGQITANPNRSANGAFWPWALNSISQRLGLFGNFGVSGQQSGAILSRLPGILAQKPGWVHVLAGTNDILGGNSTSSCLANLTSMYDLLEAAPVCVVIGTVPPTQSMTTAQKIMLGTINDFIRLQAYTRHEFILVDYEAALTDSLSGALPATYTADGIHPNQVGGFLGGKALAAALAPRLTALPPLHASIVQGGKNLLGAGGRFFGGTGDSATGWKYQNYTVAPTLTQLPPRTDGINGFWTQYSVPNGDKVDILINVPLAGSAYAVGDTLEFLLEYQASNLDPAPAAFTTGFAPLLQAYDGGVMTSKANDLQWSAGSANYPTSDRSGVFRTSPVVVPAGTVLMQCVVQIRGGGLYRFDRATLRKIN
jgi:lysophospholipase L1-like esterase